ncbi:MAG: hypothetical protein ACRDT0_08870 [Pseudonocardiaceae bacterium]
MASVGECGGAVPAGGVGVGEVDQRPGVRAGRERGAVHEPGEVVDRAGVAEPDEGICRASG